MMAGALLDTIKVTDRLLTADALYCQRQLCERMVSEGGDYLVIVKGNRQGPHESIALCFDEPVFGETYAYA